MDIGIIIHLLPLWIFILSLSVGSLVCRKLGVSFLHHPEELGFSFALGYGLLAYVIYLLGFMGLLSKVVISVTLLILSLLTFKEIWRWILYLGSLPKKIYLLKDHSLISFYLALGAILVLILAWIQCLVPPTAHDAMVYHLAIPKRFAQEGAVGYHPYLVNSLFPFLIQMHYTVALIFEQPYMANFFHFFTGVGTFVGLVGLGARFRNTKVGIVAGILFLITPGIFGQMIIPFNDVALTLFSFFAVYSVILASHNKESLSWVILAGIFSGFALSIKYLALLHILPILLIFLIGGITKKVGLGRMVKVLSVYGFFVILFSCVWYLRSYYYESNPVYPFFPSIFGGTGKEYDFAKAGYGKGILDLLLIGWRMTMYPVKFGGDWAQIGIPFLIFIPAIIFFRNHNKVSRLLLFFSLIFFMEWFYLVQNLRFLFPLIPILCFLIAVYASRYRIWLIVVLVLHLGYGAFHGRDAYAYVLGKVSHHQYLLQKERTYAISQWINDNLSPDSTILLMGDIRMFYLNPMTVREGELRRKTDYLTRT